MKEGIDENHPWVTDVMKEGIDENHPWVTDDGGNNAYARIQIIIYVYTDPEWLTHLDCEVLV